MGRDTGVCLIHVAVGESDVTPTGWDGRVALRRWETVWRNEEKTTRYGGTTIDDNGEYAGLVNVTREVHPPQSETEAYTVPHILLRRLEFLKRDQKHCCCCCC